jgi:hypothetical protein
MTGDYEEGEMGSYQRNINALIQENDALKSELRLQKEFALSAGGSEKSLFVIPERNLLEKNKELEFKVSEMMEDRKLGFDEVQALRTALHEMVKGLPSRNAYHFRKLGTSRRCSRWRTSWPRKGRSTKKWSRRISN